jgi:hypothetical protein
LTPRRIDREKLERADRECKLVLEAERKARDAKTERLRAQRQLMEASAPATPPGPVTKERQLPPRQKPARRIIEVFSASDESHGNQA